MAAHAPNHRRRTLRDYTIAVLTTLLIAAFVYLGFRAPAGSLPPDELAEPKGKGQTMMLPLNKALRPRSMDTLVDFLVVMDPTIIPHPSDINPLLQGHDVGYNPRHGEFRRRRQPLAPVQSNAPDAPNYKFTPRPAVRPVIDLAGLFDQAERTSPAAAAPTPPLPPIKPGIYWVDESGKVLKDLPALSVGSIKASKLIARGPTELECVPPPLQAQAGADLGFGRRLARLRLLRSCGNRELDQAALRHLRGYLSRLAARPYDQARQAFLAKPRVVRVHWEQLPGIKYQPDYRPDSFERLRSTPNLEAP